jgi:hypothetical protein
MRPDSSRLNAASRAGASGAATTGSARVAFSWTRLASARSCALGEACRSLCCFQRTAPASARPSAARVPPISPRCPRASAAAGA